jgi:hypothetical protein
MVLRDSVDCGNCTTRASVFSHVEEVKIPRTVWYPQVGTHSLNSSVESSVSTSRHLIQDPPILPKIHTMLCAEFTAFKLCHNRKISYKTSS